MPAMRQEAQDTAVMTNLGAACAAARTGSLSAMRKTAKKIEENHVTKCILLRKHALWRVAF